MNGQVFTRELLAGEIQAAKGKDTPIQLMVQDEDTITPVSLRYNDGLRFPRLIRIENTPDLLKEILAPMIIEKAASMQ